VLRRALVLLASASITVGLVAPASVIAAPTARYTYSPANPVAGQTTTFDGSTSYCDRTPCSYRWQDDGPDGPGGANTALGTGITLTHIFLQAGAKYVRLTVTNRRGRSRSIVKTINVAAPPPPPVDADRALNRPATASSHEQPPLYEPRFAIDGNPTTRWSSNYVDGQWWQVDLGGYYAVERVELNWEAAYASSYLIQVSDNGLVFTTVASPTISAAGHHVHSFAPTRARYVRVLGVTRATPWGISLFDAEVYGQPTDAPPPPPPPQCSDGVDNADPEDALVDLADPGCAGAADDDETDPPPPPPNPQVGLAQPDGGPNYYGRFTNPLSTSPDYFPIGVWGAYNQTAANRNLDADVGINLYVWAADPAYWDDIAGDPRFDLFGGSPDRGHANARHVNGWVLSDEIDMQQGPAACPGQIEQIKASLPQDGTVRYNNYGKGIFPGWQTDEQFACFVNSQDVTSDDIYWFTDPNACTSLGEGPSLFGLNRALTQAECRRAANYGYIVDRMRTLDARDGERRPIWNFVEVSHPWHEPSHITGPQIRAAVWHSLIAGARGIIYFQHTFELGNTCDAPHHTLRSDCHGNRAAVRAVNAQVRQLAPVLNSPTVTSGHSATGDVKYSVRWQGGKFWVLAGAHNGGGQATFSIPCVGDATAVVDGENRSIPVNGGRFTDSFEDRNSVHVYRLDGGSRCGL
jgi:F5/8 type C domain/PKD domain